jgi:hypothetical protein
MKRLFATLAFLAFASLASAQVGTFGATGQQAVTASAVAVAYQPGLAVACFKAAPGNSIVIYIGNNSSVTTSTGYPLAAGDQTCVPLQGKTGLVYVIASTTGATITWESTVQ